MRSGTGEKGNGTVGHGALDVRMRLGNAIADFDWHWREGAASIRRRSTCLMAGRQMRCVKLQVRHHPAGREGLLVDLPQRRGKASNVADEASRRD